MFGPPLGIREISFPVADRLGLPRGGAPHGRLVTTHDPGHRQALLDERLVREAVAFVTG